MAQYDIERLLSDTKSFLLAKLNAQISALNTEKNDGITLKTVDSSAYHLQYLEDRVDLADPIVLYGEDEEPEVQAQGPNTAVTYKVGITLLLSDPGTDPQIITRLLRYRRALKDVCKAYWANFAREYKLKITESLPTPPFRDQESNWTGRAVGVRVQVTIAE